MHVPGKISFVPIFYKSTLHITSEKGVGAAMAVPVEKSENYYESLCADRVAPGVWEGVVSGEWMIGQVVSGGYVTGLALECAVRELAAAANEPAPKGAKRKVNAHPDVLTANAHFLNSVYPQAFRVEVSIIKSGRTTSTLSLTLAQGEKLCLHMLITCGDIKAAQEKGPNLTRLANGRCSLNVLDMCEETCELGSP